MTAPIAGTLFGESGGIDRDGSREALAHPLLPSPPRACGTDGRARPAGRRAGAGAVLDGTLRALTVELSTDGVNFAQVGIDPEFSATEQHYQTAVQASAGHTHVRLTGTANHAGATLQVGKVVGGRRSLTPAASGSPSAAIELADGANQILIAVTAQDGVGSRTYTVTVTRGGQAIPAPPRYVKVAAGAAKLTLSWTAPAYWGSFPATGYEVDWYAGATPPT